MKTTIGTCSICRGPVCVDTVQFSTVPMPPSCAHCGAKPLAAHGPIIEMDNVERRRLMDQMRGALRNCLED